MPVRKAFQVAMLLGCVCAAGMAQTQTKNVGWESVKRIAPGQLIRVKATGHAGVCRFEQADDSGLACARRRWILFFPTTRDVRFRRESVREVKLSRQGLSTLTGAAIGAGAGAGIGAAVDASAKSQEDGHLATVLFGLLGGLLGEGIGQKTDFLAGPVVYRAP